LPERAEFDRGHDPLYRDTPLNHTLELPVLGIPVRFECNAPHAAQVIEGAYGQWRPLTKRPELIAAHQARVRVICHEGTLPESSGFPLTSRMPDNDRLMIHTPGSLALADVSRADAVIYATPALLDAGERFVSGVLDAVVLLLVTRFDRVPVHAALLLREGAGLLLCGRSRVGKSTLAYAARRRGYLVSGDDVAYVQMEPRFRVWGAARALRLPTDVVGWFSELASIKATRGPDGEEKLVVPLAGDHEAGPPVAERAVVCLLARSGDEGRLERVSQAAAVRELMASIEPGFDRFSGQLEAVLQRLCREGGWRATLPPHPADAAAMIDEMFGRLA
jgi:hypothetical protein